MKKILLLITILVSTVSLGQITVDETLTTQQLVEDILINSPCAEASNFIQSTGTNFGDDNGIAAFDANGSAFPFTNGIVLSTGNVANAPGPNLTLHSDGGVGWPGDADLEANTTATDTNNASFIQFDFVPQIATINFNFLLASEEYNQNFECDFSDAFAFILTNQVTGIVQNLAVLPGTVIPIEVTNIHPEVVGQCAAINELFFEQYNFDTGVPGLPFVTAANAAIDFNGQIIPLTAEGNVIVGNPYTIKLVVADQQDTLFDAAVFLEGGSFNIGIDLGDDLTISNNSAGCEGGSETIGLFGIPSPGATYQWSIFNTITMVFDILLGETNPTLVVSQTGTYQIEVFAAGSGGGCAGTDEVFVEFAVRPTATIPTRYDICDELPNDGFAEFDLTTKNLEITGGNPDAVVA
ncbi:MAG: hypothetical protein ACJA1Z_002029, partial [Patiriisocius sp.]